MLTGCPEQVIECGERHLPELTDRANAQLLKDLASDLSDAPQSPDRQRIEKRLNFTRFNHDETVRLLQSAGDLGNELVGGHADRGGQPEFLTDSLFDLPTNFGGGAKQQFAASDIKKGFVE